jgi:hypothetical protein
VATVFIVHTLRRRFSIWGVMFASLMTLSCLKPSYDTLLLVLDQVYDTTYDFFFYVNVAFGLSGNFSLGLVHTFLVEDHDWSIFRVGYNCIYVSVFCQHVRCIFTLHYVLYDIAIS